MGVSATNYPRSRAAFPFPPGLDAALFNKDRTGDKAASEKGMHVLDITTFWDPSDGPGYKQPTKAERVLNSRAFYASVRSTGVRIDTS